MSEALATQLRAMAALAAKGMTLLDMRALVTATRGESEMRRTSRGRRRTA